MAYKAYKGGGRELPKAPKHVSHNSVAGWAFFIQVSLEYPEPFYCRVVPLLEHWDAPANAPTDLLRVLLYIYKISDLRNHCFQLGFVSPDALVATYLNLYRWQTSPQKHFALRRLQRRWRQRWSSGKYFVNTEDPITMEPIASLSPPERWSYRDTQGNAYAFHAPSLKHFITTTGAWNPYTRLPFRPCDLLDLNTKVIQAPPIDFQIQWKTPKEAFLDVLYEYEKMGFYTLLDWFIQLTPMNIVHIYQFIAIDIHTPREFFSLDGLECALMEDPTQGAAMCFARDLKKLVESTHDLKFYTICLMFVVLATVCPLLRENIPPWTYNAVSEVMLGGVRIETR